MSSATCGRARLPARMTPEWWPRARIPDSTILHVSGVSLAISPPARESVFAAMITHARPALSSRWTPTFGSSSGHWRMRVPAAACPGLSDIFLPSLDDVALLSGREDPETWSTGATRWAAKKVVLKLGGDGAIISDGDRLERSRAIGCGDRCHRRRRLLLRQPAGAHGDGRHGVRRRALCQCGGCCRGAGLRCGCTPAPARAGRGAAVERLVAVDWGTSSLRGARFDGQGACWRSALPARHPDRAEGRVRGGVRRSSATGCGRPALRCLISGMAGSQQGWLRGAVLRLPSRPRRHRGAAAWIEAGRIAIVPGPELRAAAACRT